MGTVVVFSACNCGSGSLSLLVPCGDYAWRSPTIHDSGDDCAGAGIDSAGNPHVCALQPGASSSRDLTAVAASGVTISVAPESLGIHAGGRNCRVAVGCEPMVIRGLFDRIAAIGNGCLAMAVFRYLHSSRVGVRPSVFLPARECPAQRTHSVARYRMTAAPNDRLFAQLCGDSRPPVGCT